MKKDQFGHLAWEEKRRGRLAKLGIFDIHLVRRRSAAGQRGRFVVVDAPDWVSVVPFAEKDLVYTVRQFRHGSGRITLEFPAGVVDKGESPEEAAARELLEETGCRAARLMYLGSVNPNPAFMSNRLHTFVALDLSKDQDLSLDKLELLDLETTPLEEILKRAGEGEYDNGILLMSLHWLRRWLEEKPE